MAGRTPGRCCCGVEAASKRRCASLPWEGVRPARPFRSQAFSLTHGSIHNLNLSGSSSAPPHAPLKRRSRRGRRLKGRNSSAVSTAPILRVRAARSGGGPKAQRAGPAVLRTAKARPIRPRPVCSRRQRRAATSAGELQSAAWGGGELRDSASRRSSAQSTAQFSAPGLPLLYSLFVRGRTFFARLRDSFYFGSPPK